MTLRDSIRNDVSAIFLNTDEFAEKITYHFRDGGSVSILAIIDRDPPAFYDAAGNVVLPEFTIEINNNCLLGARSNKIDTGGDEVSLLAEIGDMIPVRKTVIRKMQEDMGALTLALK